MEVFWRRQKHRKGKMAKRLANVEKVKEAQKNEKRSEFDCSGKRATEFVMNVQS